MYGRAERSNLEWAASTFSYTTAHEATPTHLVDARGLCPCGAVCIEVPTHGLEPLCQHGGVLLAIRLLAQDRLALLMGKPSFISMEEEH